MENIEISPAELPPVPTLKGACPFCLKLPPSQIPGTVSSATPVKRRRKSMSRRTGQKGTSNKVVSGGSFDGGWM